MLTLSTTARAGDSALQLETKRGSAAWTRNQRADTVLAHDVSTAGSVVSLDAVVQDLTKDDLLRVRYPSGTGAGNSWTGRIAFAAPEDI